MPLDSHYNYREVPITVDNQNVRIGGFGNAFGQNVFQTLHTEHGVGAIISLTGNYTSSVTEAGINPKYYTHGSKVDVPDYWEKPFAETKRVEPSVYENVYDAVKSAQKAGLKTAIHCGSGDGRTGTALAALKLKELLEAEYNANPALIEMEQAKTMLLHVEDFDNNHRKIQCTVSVTPRIKEAVDFVRKFDNVEQKDAHHVSVETRNDAESLLLYERYLRSEFGKRKEYVNDVKQSIQKNPNLNVEQVFAVAAEKGHADIVKTCLERKDANLDVNRAFEDAIKNGHANVVSALIDSNHPDLNINAEVYHQGELRGPLCIAAIQGHADVVRVLLEVPLDENINVALQEMLKNRDISDDQKIKVVHVFVESKHSELDINETLEFVIKQFNNINVINALLDGDHPDLDFNKALKVAKKYGNEDTVKAIEQAKEPSPIVIHTQVSEEFSSVRRGRSHSVPMDEYSKIRNKPAESNTPNEAEKNPAKTLSK